MNDISIFLFPTPAVRAAFAVALLLVSSLNRWRPITHSNASSFSSLLPPPRPAVSSECAPMLVASFVDRISVIMLFSISIIDRNETNAYTHSTLRFDQWEEWVSECGGARSWLCVCVCAHTMTCFHQCSVVCVLCFSRILVVCFIFSAQSRLPSIQLSLTTLLDFFIRLLFVAL